MLTLSHGGKKQVPRLLCEEIVITNMIFGLSSNVKIQLKSYSFNGQLLIPISVQNISKLLDS